MNVRTAAARMGRAIIEAGGVDTVPCMSSGADPDRWHPSDHATTPALAERLCHRCPVIAQCEDFMAAQESQVFPSSIHGVAAGLSPKERARRHAGTPAA